MKRINHALLVLMLLGLLLGLVAGCAETTNDGDNGSQSDSVPGDDDDDNDDDNNDNDDDDNDDDDNDNNDDDDNDDNNDDDDDDDSTIIGTYIKSPRHQIRYFFSDLLVVIDEAVLNPDAQLILDGNPIAAQMVQWVHLADGRHTLQFHLYDDFEESVFEVAANEATQIPAYTIQNLPQTNSLPPAEGSGTSLHYRLTNQGDTAATNLRLAGVGQPDFRTVDSIQQFLLDETAAMTDREKAIYLFDFVVKWTMTSPPPGGNESNLLPDYFTGWGYGFCSSQAALLGYLAMLAGFSYSTDLEQTHIREVALNGHVLMELYFDGGWHLFDPGTQNYYTDDQGRILSLEDIEANPEQIMDFTDQMANSMSGEFMAFYVPFYASTGDNSIQPFEFEESEGGGFDLLPGDTVDFYPWGYGIIYKTFDPFDTANDPKVTGTGVLTRTVSIEGDTASSQFTLPFPIGAMLITIDTPGSGQVEVNLFIKGDRNISDEDLSLSVDGLTTVDVSEYFDDVQLGLVHEVELEILSSTTALSSMDAQVFFQFAPRMMPQVDHDRRQLVIDGQGGNLSLEVTTFDLVEEPVGIYLLANNPEPEFPIVVLADSKDLVRFMAIIGEDELEETVQAASGNRLELVCDHPDQIEILHSPRFGASKYEAVVSDVIYTGPDRCLEWNSDRANYFWARTKQPLDIPLGDVVFTLVVNGEPAAQETIEFAAAQ